MNKKEIIDLIDLYIKYKDGKVGLKKIAKGTGYTGDQLSRKFSIIVGSTKNPGLYEEMLQHFIDYTSQTELSVTAFCNTTGKSQSSCFNYFEHFKCLPFVFKYITSKKLPIDLHPYVIEAYHYIVKNKLDAAEQPKVSSKSMFTELESLKNDSETYYKDEFISEEDELESEKIEPCNQLVPIQNLELNTSDGIKIIIPSTISDNKTMKLLKLIRGL